MRDEILTYRDMCDNENIQTLQRGMNYKLNPNYSVILMSRRSNAPYEDKILDDGLTIEYEGHDIPKTKDVISPKLVDQPIYTKSGGLTQNGLFIKAVQNYKKNKIIEFVKVYEKIYSGIWSYRGLFELIDYKIVKNKRKVVKFLLRLSDKENFETNRKLKKRSRIIPTNVKIEVWKRDKGKCVICGANDELHFDHNIPYSKGGSSITAENVQILCARHNLSKSNKIK